MKKGLLTILVLLVTAPFAFALDQNVTIQWSPPTHVATGGDCNATSDPIPASDIPNITYQVEWQVASGPVQVATTAATFLEAGNVASGTLFKCRVSGFLPGQTAQCWTAWVEKVIPTPAIGCPSGVTINVQ